VKEEKLMSKIFSRASVICFATALALITAQGCSGEAGAEAGVEVGVGVGVGVGVDVCVEPGGCGLDVGIGADVVVDVSVDVGAGFDLDLCGLDPCRCEDPLCYECRPDCCGGWSGITVYVTSSTYYEVWGGDYYTGDDMDYFCAEWLGYDFLGAADSTRSFSGDYEFYVITTETMIMLDAVEGASGDYIYPDMISWGNLEDHGDIYGPPDCASDVLGWDGGQACSGGFVLIRNPGHCPAFTF
jgi:hypothetical protein